MYIAKNKEKEVLDFWKKKKIYEKVKQKNKKGKPFYFLQGPPFTSGRLHIGHAWNNCLKDAALRQKRMLGLNVWDRAGYDMHGLPTENAVQKLLKFKDKKAILDYGLAKFVKECKRFATDRVKEMDKDLWTLGVWLDFKNAYYPLDNDFMSNEWFLIKKAWEQKRLYRGKKIMHWCASCETALAKHELEYENVRDKSIFLKFKLKNKENEYLIIWTTTPWTIPFNLAVMVNPVIDYVKCKVGNETWILAKVFSNVVVAGVFEKDFKIIDEFKGEKMKGWQYEHPLDELKNIYGELKKKHKNVHTIVLSEEYVTTDAGTGLVHCAPGCGPEDFEIGQKYDIPPFNTLDEKGIFQDLNGFNGMTAKKDDSKIVEILKKKGSLLAETEVEHEYPFCWRCHKPVIFRATEQWFLKIEDLIPFLLKENEKVHWVPKWGKEAYDSWTKSLRDNSITRQRFWGTPVPIWQCDNPKCGYVEVIGSVEELKKKSKKIPIDLHKPWIDSVKWKCSKCKKGIMTRDPDVLDVWIDSGTTGWNCLYYPSKKQNWNLFPADFILEAHEHIRLWFSMLAICSAVAFKKSSFKSVYVHGMILDWKGMKMSKSLGNIISPYEVVDKVGVGAFRYYMTQLRAGENLNFNWEDLRMKQRNIQILWNLKNYLVELAKLNNFNPTKTKPQLDIEEKYMLSKTNSTIKKVTEVFEQYKLDNLVDYIEELYLELSRFYVQLIREKIVLGSKEQKKAIIWTLYNTLINNLKIFAPICPFITEVIYQELKKEFKLKEDSIHLCSWPKANEKLIDTGLEKEFETSKQIIEKILALRAEKSMGIRWPLAKAKVHIKEKLDKKIISILEKYVNIKKIEIKSGKKEMKVELDTKITIELETEGYVREFIRKIQDSRKKAGLKKENKIELDLYLEDNDLINKIKKFKFEKLIEEKTSAKLNLFSTQKLRKKREHSFEVKIKNKTLLIFFDVRK
jgi:isoleucyl-tRNA synthetase